MQHSSSNTEIQNSMILVAIAACLLRHHHTGIGVDTLLCTQRGKLEIIERIILPTDNTEVLQTSPKDDEEGGRVILLEAFGCVAP